ncbi:MAG: glutathione S-transferase [Rhizobiaceae bacterium]|nr:glutathione S-transferase [Rhizobiaceae bacterium]
MLTVWGRKTSSNVQALMWCIGELGLDYQRIDIGHRFGGNDSEQFLALNPNGTVPVLQDEDNPPLWETGSILRYLANAYGGEEFWPRDLIARANVDRWAEWAKLNVALKFTAPIFWRVVRTHSSQRDPSAIRQATDELEHFLRIANARLMKHSFLAGDELTLADIQFGHVLFRYYDIDIVRSELPALSDYYGKIKNRPAFQQHVMVSYEELRVV